MELPWVRRFGPSHAATKVTTLGVWSRRLLRPRLTSAPLSRIVADAVVRDPSTSSGQWTAMQTSQGKSMCPWLEDPPDLPPRSPNEYGPLDLMLDCPCRGGLVSGSCSSGLQFPSWSRVPHVANAIPRFLQIRPRDRHPCLDGWFRSLRPIEDLHLLNTRHAWHTRKRASPRWGEARVILRIDRTDLFRAVIGRTTPTYRSGRRVL